MNILLIFPEFIVIFANKLVLLVIGQLIFNLYVYHVIEGNLLIQVKVLFDIMTALDYN